MHTVVYYFALFVDVVHDSILLSVYTTLREKIEIQGEVDAIAKKTFAKSYTKYKLY